MYKVKIIYYLQYKYSLSLYSLQTCFKLIVQISIISNSTEQRRTLDKLYTKGRWV